MLELGKHVTLTELVEIYKQIHNELYGKLIKARLELEDKCILNRYGG